MNRIAAHRAKYNIPKGKTALITGGNSGIGFEFARHVAHYGWKVILAVRSPEKGEQAKKKLTEEFPGLNVMVMNLDLADSKSIVAFCDSIVKSKLDVDVFYANAGVYRIPYSKTDLGFEMTAGVNFVANYILFERLFPYFVSLGHRVRYILTSSIVARFASWKNDDLYGLPKYHKYKAYKKSKIAVNQLFLHMKERCQGSAVLPLLVHPGCAYTPLIDKAYANRRFALLAQKFLRLFTHSAEKAALSTVYLLQDSVDVPCFCGPRGLFHISGYPKTYPLYRGNLKGEKETMGFLQEKLGPIVQ